MCEPFDPIFLSLSVDSYDSNDASFHDLAFIYLDTAITGFTTPTFSSTLYPNGKAVSAVGRSAVDPNAHLVLSAKVSLLGINTNAYPNDNRTTRVSDGGDSGGPLFLDGTHTLVGTETRFDPGANLDYWLNFSSTVVSVIQRMVSQHGGTVNDPIFDFQEMVSTALCGRAAACCRSGNSGYLASPTKCRDDYALAGFDGTARDLLKASGAHLSINATAKSSCLLALGDTTACSSSTTTLTPGETNAAELANCIAAVTGSVANGGSGVTSAQCGTSSVCVHAANGTATCQALRAVGASCEVLDKSGSEDQRYDLGQELCSNRAGGATGNFCDGYDFVHSTYKTESTWTCQQESMTTGTACGTDAACSTNVCAPVDATTGALTCVLSTPFVNTDVCSAFQ